MSENVPMVVDHALSEQKINPNNVNLMLPSQTFGAVLGQYDKVTMEVVKVDPNPAAGDVFEIDDGIKSLGKVPLQKIASALSIIWDPKDTGIVESTEKKSRAKATGAMRKPNGEWVVVSEEKSIDISVDEDSYRLKYEEDAEKGNFNDVKEWGTSRNGKKYPKAFGAWQSEEQKEIAIDRAVRKAVLQRRKFKDELAMTGAKERVIRAFIGIKNTYTDAELQKPFAFPRVTVDTGKLLDDPSTRRHAIERMTGSANAIFGNGYHDEPQRVPTEQIEAPEETAIAESEDPPFDEQEGGDPWDNTENTAPETAQLIEALEEWLQSDIIQDNNKAAAEIRELIANENATEEELRGMVNRCQKYEQKVTGGVS